MPVASTPLLPGFCHDLKHSPHVSKNPYSDIATSNNCFSIKSFCCPESLVLGMMGTVCEGAVALGAHASPPVEKLLDLGERGSLSLAV